MVVDLDATLVTAHSEKENTAPNFKRGFGFHPLLAFVDHGPDGTGEPLSFLLRLGNAGRIPVALQKESYEVSTAVNSSEEQRLARARTCPLTSRPWCDVRDEGGQRS